MAQMYLVSSEIKPLRAQGVMWMKIWQKITTVRRDDSKETVSTRHSRTDGCINPQRWLQHEQVLQKPKTDGGPALKGEIGPQNPYNEKTISNYNLLT